MTPAEPEERLVNRLHPLSLRPAEKPLHSAPRIRGPLCAVAVVTGLAKSE